MAMLESLRFLFASRFFLSFHFFSFFFFEILEEPLQWLCLAGVGGARPATCHPKSEK